MIKQVACDVGKLPIFIDDSTSLSIRELAARARLLVQRHGVKLIVVDYIQLLLAKGEDERQRVTVISNSLRELAKEAAPVLARLPSPKSTVPLSCVRTSTGLRKAVRWKPMPTQFSWSFGLAINATSRRGPTNSLLRSSAWSDWH